MANHDILLASLVSLAVGGIIVVGFYSSRRPRTALPPGPKVDRPPSTEPWKVYQQWSKQLATPLVYLKLRGRDFLVVNKIQVALDLLENKHRNLNYSSRPDFPMMDLIGRQDNVGFQPYGPRLKKCRKLLHDALSPRSLVTWNSLLEEECDLLLRELSNSPTEIAETINNFVGSLIVRFTYGQKIDDQYLHLAEEAAKHSSMAMIPGKWLVDSYPLLRYLPTWAPGGSFQEWASEARDLFTRFTRKPFDRVKTQIQMGIHQRSFVYDNLTAADSNSLEDEAILAGTAASLYSAAIDTTSAFLLTFFLMMTVHPDIQARAYEEISSVIGVERLPVLSDAQSLPYLAAVIKELHRFNPPVPLMPRSPIAEDVYNNMRIPKKSWLFTNIWAMTHDEDDYPIFNVHSFVPERFLGADAATRDPRDMTFGFGRRRCPGLTLANAANFLAIARTLAVYCIEPTKDTEGHAIIPPVEFTTAFTSPPKAFKCRIIPRSSFVGAHNMG